MLAVLAALATASAVPPPTVSLPQRSACADSAVPECEAGVRLARAVLAGDLASVATLAAARTRFELLAGPEAKGRTLLGTGNAGLALVLDRIAASAEAARSFACFGSAAGAAAFVVGCYYFVSATPAAPEDVSYTMTSLFERGVPARVVTAIVPRTFGIGQPVDCATGAHQSCAAIVAFGTALAAFDPEALARLGSSATTISAHGGPLPFPAPTFANAAPGWRTALAAIRPPAGKPSSKCYAGRRLNIQSADEDTGSCTLTVTGSTSPWLSALLKFKGGELIDVGLLRSGD